MAKRSPLGQLWETIRQTLFGSTVKLPSCGRCGQTVQLSQEQLKCLHKVDENPAKRARHDCDSPAGSPSTSWRRQFPTIPSPAADRPDEELLLHIAKRINILYDCTQLAVRLGVSAEFVTRKQQETKDPHAIAFEVLTEWSKGEQATSINLYNCLDVDPFKQIVWTFKKELVSSGGSTESLRCHAVVKRSTSAEHFCVIVSGKLLAPWLTGFEKQRDDHLTMWFKRVLHFDVERVFFSQSPFDGSTPLFSLVNIVLHGTLLRLSKAESSHLQRELVRRLQGIVNEDVCDTIKVCSVVSYSETIHFITSIPYEKACWLIDQWLGETSRWHLQCELAKLPDMGAHPIVTVTDHLDDKHWKFTWDEVSSPGRPVGEQDSDQASLLLSAPGQVPVPAGECGLVEEDSKNDAAVIHQVFPNPKSLESISLHFDEELYKSQLHIISNMPEVLRNCLPDGYAFDDCIIAKGLRCADSSSKKLCLAFVRFKGKKGKKEDQIGLRAVSNIFKERLAELLEINPEYIDVRFIGRGSVSISFLLPMHLAQQLTSFFQREPGKVHGTFRHIFGDDSEDPVLDLTCVFTNDIVNMLSLEPNKTAATSTVEKLQKEEQSLRHLHDDLLACLKKVYSGTDRYLGALDEILTAVLENRASGVLEYMNTGDDGKIRESLAMSNKHLDRLGLLEQHDRGVFAAVDMMCHEVSSRAQAGKLRGEENVRLAHQSALVDAILIILVFVIMAVMVVVAVPLMLVLTGVSLGLFLSLYCASLLLVLALAKNTLFIVLTDDVAVRGDRVLIISLLHFIIILLFIRFLFIKFKRRRRQFTAIEEKSRQWVENLNKMQEMAVFPKKCFATAAGIAVTVRKHTQAVVDALNVKKPDMDMADDVHCALVENQLVALCEAAKEGQGKVKQLQQTLREEDLRQKKLQWEFQD